MRYFHSLRGESSNVVQTIAIRGQMDEVVIMLLTVELDAVSCFQFDFKLSFWLAQ